MFTRVFPSDRTTSYGHINEGLAILETQSVSLMNASNAPTSIIWNSDQVAFSAIEMRFFVYVNLSTMETNDPELTISSRAGY